MGYRCQELRNEKVVEERGGVRVQRNDEEFPVGLSKGEIVFA